MNNDKRPEIVSVAQKANAVEIHHWGTTHGKKGWQTHRGAMPSREQGFKPKFLHAIVIARLKANATKRTKPQVLLLSTVHKSNRDASPPQVNHDLHAVDATPARWRAPGGLSPLDSVSTVAFSSREDLVKNYRVHSTHWLIYAQVIEPHPARRRRETHGPEERGVWYLSRRETRSPRSPRRVRGRYRRRRRAGSGCGLQVHRRRPVVQESRRRRGDQVRPAPRRVQVRYVQVRLRRRVRRF